MFPGSLNEIFPAIPFDLKAHFDTSFFKRVCKTHFKYLCPHAQGKDPDDCDNCLEKTNAIMQTQIHCTKIWRKKIGFSLNFVYSETSLLGDNSDVPKLVSEILNKHAVNLIPLYES